jgi:hypothetical protein
VQSITAKSPPESSEPARCHAVFVPADPARAGRIALWRPDGIPPSTVGFGSAAELTVAVPGEHGIERVRVPAVLLPLRAALPVLTRARTDALAHRSTVFWGSAGVLALHFLARGLLLPGLSPADHDAWRIGPLSAREAELVRELAASMPPEAHAVPVTDAGPPRLPTPERLLRAFLDAVADALPRSPAAHLVTGGPAYAAVPPQLLPGHRNWVDDLSAGHDSGVRLSLRIEVPGLDDAVHADIAPRFHAVLQVHTVTGPTAVADASEVWSGSGPSAAAFGPRARWDALLALRRAARAWPPLAALLAATVPDRVELGDDEVADLLGAGGPALSAAGVEVHWPKGLSRELSARVDIGPPNGSDTRASAHSETASFLSAEARLASTWWFTLDGRELSRGELEKLAQAKRPLVRLRDQWVLIDPQETRRIRERKDREVTPAEALGAALTGTTEIEGHRVEVRPTGWLAELREQLTAPETQQPVGPPAALAATLRDYQIRGFGWLARMSSLGLGCCLADDMGLGKTVTLIALHLHRQADVTAAGPTLVVCPASLLGNWQREIERFAPGTPVRRFHGPQRSLDSPADGEFVLTTYGTLRLHTERLGEVSWGLIVADEAQHVNNPYSATARALRLVGARARVALTGTPVENNLSELWAILDFPVKSAC